MATSWKVEPGHSVVHVIDADGRTICVVGSGPYWQPYGQQDLDHARLIAAAPDMAAALTEAKKALSYAMRGTSDAEQSDKYAATIARIDAALGKAGA